MNPDDLEKRIKEIKNRCDNATEAPWRLLHSVEEYGFNKAKEINRVLFPKEGALDTSRSDGEFIAHSRTDIPFLLDQLQKYKRAVEIAREALKEHHRNIMECGVYDDALTEIDKILGKEK